MMYITEQRAYESIDELFCDASEVRINDQWVPIVSVDVESRSFRAISEEGLVWDMSFDDVYLEDLMIGVRAYRVVDN